MMSEVMTWDLAYRLYCRGLSFWVTDRPYEDDRLKELARLMHASRTEWLELSGQFSLERSERVSNAAN